CQYMITPIEIEHIFGRGDIYDKFHDITLRQALQRMEGSIGCPTPACNNWVVVDPHSKVKCVCSGCHFEFCSMCREAYHYGTFTCAEIKGLQMAWLQWNMQERDQVWSQEQNELLRVRREELRKRMEDLKRDEEWKEKHLRLCPKCSRA